MAVANRQDKMTVLNLLIGFHTSLRLCSTTTIQSTSGLEVNEYPTLTLLPASLVACRLDPELSDDLTHVSDVRTSWHPYIPQVGLRECAVYGRKVASVECRI